MEPAVQSPALPLKDVLRARRGWLRGLFETAAVVVAITVLQAWLTHDVVRGHMPAIEGILLEGLPAADWQAARRGEAYVVYVWGTWCPVCSTMQGNLDAITRDAAILTVAQRSGTGTEVGGFLQARGLRWPTVNDPDGVISGRLGIEAVPMLLFVDRSGVVRAVTRGYTTEPGIRLRLWWVAGRS